MQPFVLATDLDGTLLGGSPDARQAFYADLRANEAALTLIFVTGRDLGFIEARVAEGELPPPDYVIADVGTTAVHWPSLAPLPVTDGWIEGRWQASGPEPRQRIAETLDGVRGLSPQDYPPARRLSYHFDAQLDDTAKAQVEAVGFDVVMSAGIFFDVLPRGVNKGSTLLRVLGELALEAQPVLVAGDSLNDASLYDTGLPGVVVGNAEAGLKALTQGQAHVHQSEAPGVLGIRDGLARFGFGPACLHP